MNYITIHAADTYPDMDIGVAEITRWHTDRGWRDIGYHEVIRRDGTIEAGRPADQMGAHVGGHNRGNYGICMVGGKSRAHDGPEDNFTPEQYQALHNRMLTLHKRWPDADILGHNGFKGHEARGCPCFDWIKWRRDFMAAIAEPQLPSHWIDEVTTDMDSY